MSFKTNWIIFSLLLTTSLCMAQKQMDEPTSYKDDLSINWYKSDGELILMAKNKLLAPLTIVVTSRTDSTDTQSFILLPKDSVILTTLGDCSPDSTCKSTFHSQYRIDYYWGHASLINPDLDHLYRLPLKKGKWYEVSQTFNGKVSHFGPVSRYAIDFSMPVGEPIYAARAGTVVQVIDWFTKQGGIELKNAANRIIIMHADGTFGFYVHLKYKGSLVKVGDEVEEGQKIGFSGLTGYTNGPHLHFIVRKENNIAIPVYFKGYDGKVLKRGRRYKVKDN